MKGLYPIIRRVRRPLLPVAELQAPQWAVESSAEQHNEPSDAATPQVATELTTPIASNLQGVEPVSQIAVETIATTQTEPSVQPPVVEAKPKRASNGRKAKSENA